MRFTPLLSRLEALAPKIMEISILGYLSLIPWEHTSAARNLFLGLGLSAWALERYLFKKKYSSGFLEKYIILYVAAILISVFFSQDLLISVLALRGDLSKFILIYILTAHVYREPASVHRLFYGLIASSTLVTAYGMAGFLFRWPSTLYAGGEAMGPFAYYNAFGHYLALHGLILLSIFLEEKKFSLRFILGILTPFQFILILLTKSRTALAAFMIGSASLFLLKMGDKKKVLPAFLLILIILGLGLNDEGIFLRFKTILEPVTYKAGIGRFEVWSETIEWVKEHPWVGHGYGGNLYREVSRIHPGTHAPHAHNLFLQLLFESGIFGLATFLLLFFRVAWEAFRFHRRFRLYPFLFSFLLLIFLLSITEPIFLAGHFGVFLWTAFALVTTTRDFKDL